MEQMIEHCAGLDVHKQTVAVYIRVPVSVHHGRGSLDFPMRSAPRWTAERRGISRFSCRVCRNVHGVSDRAGSPCLSRWRGSACGLPRPAIASAPRSVTISRLDTQPVPASVNASRSPLRTPAHDSRSEWLARPSLCGSCIHNTLPVYPAHSRLRKNSCVPLSLWGSWV